MLAGQYARSHRDYLPQMTLPNEGLLEIPAKCIGEGNSIRRQTFSVVNLMIWKTVLSEICLVMPRIFPRHPNYFMWKGLKCDSDLIYQSGVLAYTVELAILDFSVCSTHTLGIRDGL